MRHLSISALIIHILAFTVFESAFSAPVIKANDRRRESHGLINRIGITADEEITIDWVDFYRN